MIIGFEYYIFENRIAFIVIKDWMFLMDIVDLMLKQGKKGLGIVCCSDVRNVDEVCKRFSQRTGFFATPIFSGTETAYPHLYHVDYARFSQELL